MKKISAFLIACLLIPQFAFAGLGSQDVRLKTPSAGILKKTASAGIMQNSAGNNFTPAQASAYWDFGTASDLALNNDGTGGAPADTNTIKWATDLSGHGHHMREHSGETAPTWSANSLGGKGTAVFNGTSVLESVTDLTHANQSFTIIAVGKRSGVGAGLTAFFTGGVTSYTVPGSAWFQIQTPESADWQLEGSGGSLDLGSGVSYGSRYEMFTAVRDGNAPVTTLYTGGEQRITTPVSYTLATSGAAFIGNWSTTNGVNANIAAIMFFDHALTNNQRVAAELYLANRFSVWAPDVTWPSSYESFNQASILDAKLNAHEIAGSRDILKYFYSSQNIDALGTSNASLTNHDVIATWKNLGAVGATGDAAQATANYKPSVEKAVVNGVYAGVGFGGNSDFMSLGGATTNLNFIQNTGHFDIIVVGRRDIPNESVILSSTEAVAEKGFDFKFNDDNELRLSIYNGSGTAAVSYAGDVIVPIGDTYFIETKGDGSFAYINDTHNLGEVWNSSALGATTSGDSTNATYMGMHFTDNVESYDGVFNKIAIYSEPLSTAARALIKADVVPKYTDAVTNYKIACLGDSITINYLVDAMHPYPHKLEQLLGPGYVVANIAESGYTAQQMKELLYEGRVKRAPISPTLDYDLFTVMIGINDIRVGTGALTTFNTYTAAVLDDIFLIYGKTVIPMTITPFNNYSAAWTSGKQTELETYNDLVKISAYAYGGNAGSYVDTYELLKDPANPTAILPALDKGDNLHPNQVGTYMIAQELYNQITGTRIQEWRDGASVGNFSNAANWQEISGGASATSQLNQNRYSFIISDSPANMLAAVSNNDASNKGVFTFHSPAPTFSDIEDVATCPVSGNSYVYVADIGDNGAARSTIQIIRTIEPTVTGSDQTIPSVDYQTITCAYPDGAKDAECLLVNPVVGPSASDAVGDMYIISKRESIPGVYKLSHASSYSGTQTLTYMGKMYDIPDITTSALGAQACNVVGGSISPNGKEILIKNYNDVYLFTRDPATQTVYQALQGTPTLQTSYVGGGSVSPAKSHPNAEPQGEAVWYAADGKDYFTASEYVTGQGSTASTYPFFRYHRLNKASTTVSFQDGVSPTAGYTGTRDTTIWDTNPDVNYGTDVTDVLDKAVGIETDQRKELVKWDMSADITAATSLVVGAKMDRWIAAEGQGFAFYRILTANWVETTSTYNTLTAGINDDGTEASSTASGGTNGINLDTIVSLNLRHNLATSDVQAQVTTSATNYGYLGEGTDITTGDGVQFDSRDGVTASRRPKLTVRYVTYS